MGTTLRLRLASSGYEPREHHVSECGERRERDRDGEGRRHRKGHERRRREKPAAGRLEVQMDGEYVESLGIINHSRPLLYNGNGKLKNWV